MSFLNSFFIDIFYKQVGEDQFGNKYYESKAKDYLKRSRRYVTYNGIDEPSKVPPLWHSWLHHLSNELPVNEVKNFAWQVDYLPNLTGTKYANKIKLIEDTNKISSYEKWNPK